MSDTTQVCAQAQPAGPEGSRRRTRLGKLGCASVRECHSIEAETGGTELSGRRVIAESFAVTHTKRVTPSGSGPRSKSRLNSRWLMVGVGRKGPMTAAEVALWRRRSRFVRLMGLAVAILVLLAAVAVAAGGDWGWGLIYAAVAVVMYLNFGVYVPWIFEREIRKRGVLVQ